MQYELLGSGVSGYQMPEMCRETCEYHVPLVLNEEPKANLLKPSPFKSSLNDCNTVKGQTRNYDIVEASNISSVSHDLYRGVRPKRN